jgi:hypothetical protein
VISEEVLSRVIYSDGEIVTMAAADMFGGVARALAVIPAAAPSSSPTTEEMAGWAFASDALSWAGFTGDPDNQDTPEASWLTHLGYELTTPLREFGAIPEADYVAELTEWLFDGRRPALALRTRARQAGHAARVFLGIDYTVQQRMAEDKAEVDHNREIEWYRAQPGVVVPSQPTGVTPGTAVPGVPPSRLVNFRDISDSGRSDQVAVLDFTAMEDMRAHYKKVTLSRRGPPDGMEPTAEQMSTLCALLRETSAPYTDFALWGPNGNRTLRKILSTGLMFAADGTLQRLSYSGPHSFEQWKICWKVYEVAMIMADAATPPVLTAYAAHVESMAKQFGPTCWAVLYQAENRFRRERLEYLRRSESDLLNASIASGGLTAFDPKMPWERCFDIAPDQFHWWNKEVTIPCLMVVSKARAAGFFLEGDSAISNSDAAHIATAAGAGSYPGIEGGRPASSHPPPGNSRRAHDGDSAPGPPKKKAKKEKGTNHDVKDGSYVSNRQGQALCRGFQTGGCSNQNCAYAHQCAKCLNRAHGASHPSPCSMIAPSTKPGGKGKGKGKGGRF